jgi:hypothetical protein
MSDLGAPDAQPISGAALMNRSIHRVTVAAGLVTLGCGLAVELATAGASGADTPATPPAATAPVTPSSASTDPAVTFPPTPAPASAATTEPPTVDPSPAVTSAPPTAVSIEVPAGQASTATNNATAWRDGALLAGGVVLAGAGGVVAVRRR